MDSAMQSLGRYRRVLRLAFVLGVSCLIGRGSVEAVCANFTVSGSNLYTTGCTNVGVGTSSPAYLFHVEGAGGSNKAAIKDTNSGGHIFLFNNGGTTSGGYAAGAGYFTLDDATSSYSLAIFNGNSSGTNAGYVAFGTNNPWQYVSGAGYSRVLEVASAAQTAINVQGNASADGTVGDVAFTNKNVNTSDSRIGLLRYSRSGSDAAGQFEVWTHKVAGGAAWIQALVIAPNGDATFSGNVTSKYQDIAEWVPARERFSSGTVLVLDSERRNGVVAATRAYDTSVAGVVSERPGFLLGEQGEGKVMVATTGRVRVKVDARNPIRVGDLLVTSDRPGFAMRSVPIDVGGNLIHRPGTLIGKALEPLAGGDGEILTLLSLQ